MVSAETLLSYPDWKICFTVHTNASDKQLGAVINQNNKPIAFLSRRPSKPQSNYTTANKELLVIVERLKTWSIPICPLRYHSMVCIENHLFIVGIGPILNKFELFIENWSYSYDK